MKITWMIMALISGALLPIQAGLNTKLGKSIESPIHASLISFIVGAIAVMLYVLLSKHAVVWAGLKTTPAYTWAGGIFGAFYVTAIILAFPKIGTPLTFGLVVTGQMIASVLLDHFDILVSQQHSINIWRTLGVVFIITGIVIIRKF